MWRHAPCGTSTARVRVRAGGEVECDTTPSVVDGRASARSRRITLYEATFCGPRAAPSPRVCGNCVGCDGDAASGNTGSGDVGDASHTGLLAEPTDAFRGAPPLCGCSPALEAMLEFELGRESAGDVGDGAFVSHSAARAALACALGGSGGSSASAAGGGGGVRRVALSEQQRGGAHGGDGGRPGIAGRRRGGAALWRRLGLGRRGRVGRWARGRRSQGCVVFCLWDQGVGKESMVALSASSCAGVVTARSSCGRWGGEPRGGHNGRLDLVQRREGLCALGNGSVLSAPQVRVRSCVVALWVEILNQFFLPPRFLFTHPCWAESRR